MFFVQAMVLLFLVTVLLLLVKVLLFRGGGGGRGVVFGWESPPVSVDGLVGWSSVPCVLCMCSFMVLCGWDG